MFNQEHSACSLMMSDKAHGRRLTMQLPVDETSAGLQQKVQLQTHRSLHRFIRIRTAQVMEQVVPLPVEYSSIHQQQTIHQLTSGNISTRISVMPGSTISI